MVPMQVIKQKAHNILRWSEKYTKTDMVYLARGNFWLFLTQAVAMGGAFILSIVFANLVSKHDYGVYRYIISLAGIIFAFTLGGMDTAVSQAVARGFNGALNQGIKTYLKWSTGATIFCLSAAGYYFLKGDNILGVGLLIAGICSPIINSFSLTGSFLNGKKDFRSLGLLGSINNILPVVCIFTALMLSNNILVIVFVYFISNVLGDIAVYLWVKRKYTPMNGTDPSMISYGKHLSLANVLYAIADQVDRIILFHYFGAVELAIYSFAVAIPTQFSGAFKNISLLAMPRFAEQDKKSVLSTINDKTIKITLATTVIVIVYILLAPVIFNILFPKYTQAITLSMIFALSIIPANAGMLFSTYLRSHRETKAIYIQGIFSPLVRILLFFIFGYFFGALGVVWAMVIAKTFTFILLRFYLIPKQENFNPIS